MKIKLAALTLLCVAMICSESNADLLGRMLGKSGCGECEAAPTCCETPDPCCGRGISISLHIGLPGRLFNGCGCKPECEEQVEDACDDGCGGGRIKSMFAKVFNGCCKEDACEEPEPACEEADDCGCKLFSRGLFSRFCDNGCEEEPACEDACGCGMNLDLRGKVSGLVSRVGSMGCNTCCEEEPAAEPARCRERETPIDSLRPPHPTVTPLAVPTLARANKLTTINLHTGGRLSRCTAGHIAGCCGQPPLW